MNDQINLFRGENYIINDLITIKQPTLDEIFKYGEQKYYGMISTLCAVPSDYKVLLLDYFNMDYEEMTEFELFILLLRSFTDQETLIIFENGINFKNLEIGTNSENGETILHDKKLNLVIDRNIYNLIAVHLRKMHGFEKKIDKAGNERTKQYLLDRDRRQMSRNKNKKYSSTLIPLISAMVNCEHFKYNYETVWNLKIYPFMDSVKRIQKIINYNQTMQGVYSGNVDYKGVSGDTLNWMSVIN